MVYGICYFTLTKSEKVKNLGVAGKLINLVETIREFKMSTNVANFPLQIAVFIFFPIRF